MSEALRRLKRTTVEGVDGFWRLHMVAFLDPAPAGGSFRLRATDVTDPKDRREVKMFEVDGQPGQTTSWPINDLVVTEVMGFERGHRYEIAVIPRGDDLPCRKRRRLRQRGDNPDVSVSPPSVRPSCRVRRGRSAASSPVRGRPQARSHRRQ